MIRWTLWLIKDFIDPVSTRAHTRTPSIKQSTNGWLISILFKFVLTIGWSLLPPERGPSLRCLKEQDKHERHVLVLCRRSISANVPIEVHVLGAGNREKSVQLVSSWNTHPGDHVVHCARLSSARPLPTGSRLTVASRLFQRPWQPIAKAECRRAPR